MPLGVSWLKLVILSSGISGGSGKRKWPPAFGVLTRPAAFVGAVVMLGLRGLAAVAGQWVDGADYMAWGKGAASSGRQLGGHRETRMYPTIGLSPRVRGNLGDVGMNTRSTGLSPRVRGNPPPRRPFLSP